MSETHMQTPPTAQTPEASMRPPVAASNGAHAMADDDFVDGFAAGNNAPEAVDLSADPFADDLSAELAAAAPKQWHNRATRVLAVVALLAVGFVGGVLVQRNLGATTTGNGRAAASQFAQGRGGLGGTGGFGRNGGFGGTGGSGTGGTGAAGTGSGSGGAASTAPGAGSTGATSQTNSGKVTLVDGTTVYVTLTSGDVLTVKTTSSTKVSVGSATKVSSLKTGESVTVTGPTDSSGNVTATSITAGS